jgi:hypothetical protein
METMIITATSAGIGICFTHGPSTTSSTRRNTPAVSAESRPRPPDFTLMTDWPIIAQPAMPPKRPETMLATPWPVHSRFLSLGVSVRSSTICAVISDSSKPTAANPSEYGSTIHSVSSVHGTCGQRNTGSDEGSSPRSPTRRTSSCSHIARIVSTTMATSGEGTALVTRGSR